MPYVKIWIHLNWTTYRRERLITPELKKQLLPHIVENAKLKSIYIDTLNCIEDHIHLLISLKANQSVSAVMQLIKGESSHWVNQLGLLHRKFGWQDDFYGESVSESALGSVRRYIEGQEEHHRRKSYEEECSESHF